MVQNYKKSPELKNVQTTQLQRSGVRDFMQKANSVVPPNALIAPEVQKKSGWVRHRSIVSQEKQRAHHQPLSLEEQRVASSLKTAGEEG